MQNKRIVVMGVIGILLAIIVLMLGQLNNSYGELQAIKSVLATYQQSQKVLNFTKLFVEKVLTSTKVVSFEDRLRLENSIRDINDVEISDQWQKFVDSKNEAQVQVEVKNLLKVLVSKI